MKRNEIPAPVAGHQKASAAVTAALGTLAYPISKEEAIRKVGDWQIPWSKTERVPLGDVLRGVPADVFEDVAAAAAAVDRYWGRLAENLDAIERAEAAARHKGR